MTDESAVEVVQDVFRTCLQKFRIDCVKPRTLEWVKRVSEKNSIRITEDLALVKTYSPEVQEIRGLQKDILESFEDFLQTHDLVAKVPSLLRPDGPFGTMTMLKICLGICLVALVCGLPVEESSYAEEKSTDFEDDPLGYLQEKLMSFFDGFLEKDHVQVSDDVEVSRNSVKLDQVSSRGADYEEKLQTYLKTHKVSIKMPFVGTITIGARNLDSDELDFNLNFGGTEVVEGRKSKLKKILIPILVFILLKAITVVPLALGVLILKAWNALQLSFFSFVISTGLAIFQLCKKIAENNAHAQISAHGPWESPVARSMEGQEGIKANSTKFFRSFSLFSSTGILKMAAKFVLGLSLIAAASALPSNKPAFWKGTPLDSHVEKMKSSCVQEDTIACWQYKAFTFLDTILQKDYFQFGGMEVKRNSYPSNEITSRSENNLEDGVEGFIKTHNVKLNLPLIARKKSKLKKIFIPILVFLLLKAITLVPLAIGILGLKAWNGLQLSFISFIISTGLAIFQLCQKLAADGAHAHPHISAAAPWESPVGAHYARSLGDAHKMAYNAYE
ncbi:unnamed protein product [Phaedon cochleariae]|uniref:Osiris 19 n=1 Tax=Phaedon cochleariae TaxID=80249 RepID=A0A9N9SCA9_PHACE|nr:unnamed protein product [Phaedon cochleariae]